MGKLDKITTPDYRELMRRLPLFVSKIRNEYIMPEHLLYLMLDNERICALLDNLSVDRERLRGNLAKFIDERLEKVDVPAVSNSVAFSRIISVSHQKVISSSRKELDVVDLLVSLLDDEERSHASFFLRRQGIDQYAVIREISNRDYSVNGFSGEPLFQGAAAENQVRTENAAGSESKALSLYTVNMSALAKAGKIERIIGREAELAGVMRTLSRKKKNNPLLVGEAGVGKTAIVEGLAWAAANGNVPERLKNIEIFAIDMGSLIAGTKFRGEFEERLKNLINELVKRPESILFIDEMHTVVGAGATGEGAMDASNILKPALNSGALRCIGATTYEEYKNHVLKDKAFSRRFQKIDVPEPRIDEALLILTGAAPYYEDHYKIKFTADALKRAVDLSAKYMNDRFLPDKALDLIDEAAAKNSLKTEPLAEIGVAEIEEIVAEILKIPVSKLTQNDSGSLRELGERLRKVVIGQDEAVESVVKAIKIAKAGIGNKDRPIGVFLFAGPTGVGKTELAKSLAAQLGVDFIRFDMSEYAEEYSISKLIGSSPGYVGFEQGGLLTEQIIRKPHAVLLLDEIEKAHRKIYDVLLQVMDYGRLTDNTGRKADFRNIILIMSSNVGARAIEERPLGFVPADETASRSEDAVKKHFTPEFRNRLDGVMHFHPLSMPVMEKIVDKFIGLANAEFRTKDITIELDASARSWFARNGFNEKLGARPLERLIRREITEKAVDEILFGKLVSGGIIKVGADGESLKLNITGKQDKCQKSQAPEKKTSSRTKKTAAKAKK